MTIVEHLQELRSRILKAFAGVVVGTILGFIWYGTRFDPGAILNAIVPGSRFDVASTPVASLGDILKGPYCQLPPEMRLGADECRLLATSPFEMFLLRMKVGALAGVVISSPWWLYQIWAFVTPGLVRKEKRMTLVVVALAGLLFITGAVLAYVVVAYGLEFLLTIGDEAQVSALTGERYFGFIILLIIIFGLSFEVPLFIVMLNIVGVLRYEHMQGKRRLIILLTFVFAAFATPGQDPISMVALALSLSLLIELAIQFCRINDKRRDRERPEWMDLDDESASAIGAAAPIADTAEPIGSGPVGSSGRVRASSLGAGEAVSASPVDAPAPVGGPSLLGGGERVTASPVDAPAPVGDRPAAPPAPRKAPGGVARPRTQRPAPGDGAGFTYGEPGDTDYGDVL
ncbi:twin-arginine translocase subunit TatC [Corynebacterium sp. 335C]